MNEFRNLLKAGNAADIASPISAKESCRRRPAERSLMDILIPREERRITNQRREDRYRGIVERASIVFRRKKVLAKVVNVSGGGVMVEAAIVPRIGEQVSIEFEGFEPVDATVRWIKQGRIGLDVGEGGIDLG